jgi:hypothetical protein
MIATHRHVNYAKDEEEMKIPCQDPSCPKRSWVESTHNTLLCVSLEMSSLKKWCCCLCSMPTKREAPVQEKSVASSFYSQNVISLCGAALLLFVTLLAAFLWVFRVTQIQLGKRPICVAFSNSPNNCSCVATYKN